MVPVLINKGSFFCSDQEEGDFEYLESVAEEWIEAALKKGKRFIHIKATRINWRGADGFATFPIDDLGNYELWRKIAGVDDYTIRFVDDLLPGKDFTAIVSSHDVPTGGERVVKALSQREAFHLLRDAHKTTTPKMKMILGETIFPNASKSDCTRLTIEDFMKEIELDYDFDAFLP